MICIASNNLLISIFIALKIGKSGEQNGQSIDVRKNKEEGRKEYSSPVSVGRGIGRGNIQKK